MTTDKLIDDLTTIFWMVSDKASKTKKKKEAIKLKNTATVIYAARSKIEEQAALITDLKKLIP